MQLFTQLSQTFLWLAHISFIFGGGNPIRLNHKRLNPILSTSHPQSSFRLLLMPHTPSPPPCVISPYHQGCMGKQEHEPTQPSNMPTESTNINTHKCMVPWLNSSSLALSFPGTPRRSSPQLERTGEGGEKERETQNGVKHRAQLNYKNSATGLIGFPSKVKTPVWKEPKWKRSERNR